MVVQAGLPDGTRIARIHDGVALLQCAQDWEACLSLSPVQIPDASAAQPSLELEQGQAVLDSQGESEAQEAQVTPSRTIWSIWCQFFCQMCLC